MTAATYVGLDQDVLQLGDLYQVQLSERLQPRPTQLVVRVVPIQSRLNSSGVPSLLFPCRTGRSPCVALLAYLVHDLAVPNLLLAASCRAATTPCGDRLRVDLFKVVVVSPTPYVARARPSPIVEQTFSSIC